MTQISALPTAANAVGTADIFVLDQIDSAVLTTTQVSAANVRTFMQNNLGTVAFEAMPAAGLVRSTGTHLADATIGIGLTLDSGGTLSNTGLLGLSVASPLSYATGTLELDIGKGLLNSANTLINTGVIQFGTDNGTITIGSGLSEASGTLTNTGVLSITAGTNITITGSDTINAGGTGITQIGTDTGPTIDLTGAFVINSHTLGLVVASGALIGGASISGSGLVYSPTGTAAFIPVSYGQGVADNSGTLYSTGIVKVGSFGGALGQNTITLGSGGSIDAGGTLTFTSTGAAITAGTGISITGTDTINNTGVLQFGTDTGTITIVAPLQEASGSLTLNYGAGLGVTSSTLDNTGVLAVGATAGSIVLGSNLSMSGQTLNATGGGVAAPSAGLVSSNGTILEDTTIVGGSWSGGTLTISGSGIQQLGTSTGPTIALSGGLAITSGTLAPVLASGATVGGVSVSGSGHMYSASGTGALTPATAGQGIQFSTASIDNIGIIKFGGYGAALGSNTITLCSSLVMNSAVLSEKQALNYMFPGLLTGGEIDSIVMMTAGTLLANGGAHQAYIPTNPTATNTLLVNTVHSGTITTQGTITIATSGAVTFPTFSAVIMAAGDVVQLQNQATADVSLANPCFAFQYQVT